MRTLPERWEWRELGSLATPGKGSITDGPFGSNLKTEHYTDCGPRVVRLQNIGDGSFVDARAHISPEHFNRLLKHSVEAGDLVVASLGKELPRACLVPEGVPPAIVKADCIRVRLGQEVDAKYINYYLNSPECRHHASEIIHGVGRPRLNLGEIRRIPIPVAPLDEQHRIVEAIETHLSHVDAGVEALQRAERNIERMRASLLRAAVEGALVPRDVDGESVAALLDRIGRSRSVATTTVNRRRHQEGNLHERVEATGSVPGHWAVVALATLAQTNLGKMLSKEARTGVNPKPYLRNQNVQWGRFDLTDVAEMDILPEEEERFRVIPGDLMVCEGGEVARCAIWKGELSEVYYQKALHRVRPYEGVRRDWLALVLEYLAANKLLGSFVTGSTIDHLPQEDLRRIPIPLPSENEQRQILDEVERQVSLLVALARQVGNGLNRATGLRRAILAAAFSGRLVDGDEVAA